MLLSRLFCSLLCKTHIFKKPSILKWEKRVFYDFTPSSSSSRPFWFKTVFPDSAEFLHFGEDLKSLVNSYWGFLRIFKIGLKFCKCYCYLVIFFSFLVFFKFWAYFGKCYCYLAIFLLCKFHCGKWTNIEQIIWLQWL